MQRRYAGEFVQFTTSWRSGTGAREDKSHRSSRRCPPGVFKTQVGTLKEMSVHLIALVAALAFPAQSGLVVKDVADGTGRRAEANDIVTVEYTGTLTDGKQFQSSKG